jgi:hypothetical protein
MNWMKMSNLNENNLSSFQDTARRTRVTSIKGSDMLTPIRLDWHQLRLRWHPLARSEKNSSWNKSLYITAVLAMRLKYYNIKAS